VLAAEEAKKEAEKQKTEMDGAEGMKSAKKSSEDTPKENGSLPNSDAKEIEERLSNLQDLLVKQMQAEKEEKEEKDEKENTNQAYFALIRKKLIDNEVEETYVDQILDDISENLSKNVNLDSILAGVYQKIVLKIGQPHLIDVKTKRTKFIFFVGPTGVGKTTTIAKIASTLKLTKKTKVALITSDTYRIAAVEQLKTYANILGIPLKVVYSIEDMEHAVEQLRDFDLVFVDTAGRSHNNKEQREDIHKLLDIVEEADREVFLVLSATTKYRDLVKISQTYSEITKYSLIFTKLDETDTIGSIFNIHMLTGAPLSYTTWGQNVPDDIGKIDAQSIAKQLLGGNS
jgi:flagellar biosynthesis protein FlhF